jgi:Family of unknown function (DUF6529)
LTVSQEQRYGVALWFAILVGVAALITAGLYVFGTQHVPDYTIGLFGSTGEDTLPLKSWLASGVLALAALQLGLALWIFGKLPRIGSSAGEIVTLHRAVGVVAILLTLPIAYHCILAYGVQTHVDTRVAVHSLAGCFLYGAIGAKLLIVRSKRFPGWTLPLAGGTLVVVIAILWYTSALWYFDDFSLPTL